MVGRTVHQYQFLEKLGSGGMGEIYKAQDTRLGRFVAIKVLTRSATGDPERRKRFTQEAQAASALNHPNIITIHDIVSEEGNEFMVMEYVAGKTLVDVIPKGGLRIPQALKYAVQMADALQIAHQAGIVHRDLKPANVMVTEAGLVKILDFGLAKLTDRGPLSQMNAGPTDETQTISDAPLTVEGSIIGTVSYMSPEQAQGKKVDTRSDIFSFGVVLYEMVTGVRAFEGESALSTLSAILRDTVKPIADTAPDCPRQMEMVVERCLRKQPDDRWQTMKDVQMALAALKHESDSGLLYRARLSEVTPPAQATAPSPAPGGGARAAAAAAPAKAPPVPRPPSGKGLPAPALAGILAAVVVLGGAIGGGLWWKHHKRVLQDAQQAAEIAAAQAAAAQAPAQATPPLAATPPPEAAAPEPPPAEVMTNDTVLDMVKAKVSPNLIMSEIRAAKSTNFAMSPAELIRLTKAGVPDQVLEQMRNPKRAVPAAAPKTVASTPAPKETPPPVATPQPPPQQPVQQQPAPQPPPPQPVKPAAPAAAPSTPPVQAAKAVLPQLNITIPDGTVFSMTLAQDVPETAAEGTPIRFTVDQEVKVQDTVVIAKGASVTGVIAGTSGKKLGVFGGGKMLMKLNEVDAAGGHKLSVHLQRTGDATRPLEIKPRKSKDVVAAAGTDGYVAYINGTQTLSVQR